MKILVIGAAGTIGSAIVKNLQIDAEIITAGMHSGDYKIDLSDHASIQAAFDAIGTLDAVVVAAGAPTVFKHASEMQIADYVFSFQYKLLGQLDVALAAVPMLNDGGSITLTSGVLNRDFIKHGSAAAVVNAAVEAFVQSTAWEMPRAIRINVVSPCLLEESAEKYAAYFPGFPTVPSAAVAQAYRKSIYGIQTGQIYRIGG